MKTLTIGSTTIEITDFTKIRNAVVGVYAEIKFPKKTITSADVWALFDNNQHDLVVTEEDGSITTYKGYSECESVKETKDEFLVTQICASEAMHRVNEANKQIENLEKDNATLQAEVIAQNEEIVMLNDTLLEVLMG